MTLQNKPFEELDEQDLLDLIASGVPEDRSLDYKLELPGNSTSDKKEFLADISAFANANGGFIVFGMDEDQGLPTALPGITGLDMDAEILRLENLVQSSIDHRIPGISMRSIILSNGASALIVKIPKSWISPHMVTLGGSSRFYSRNSAGKYPLDVNEIRGAFLATEAISDRIREFRLDRISKIIAGDTPVPLPDGAKVILHLIPVGNFLSRGSVNLAFAEENFYRISNLYTSDYNSPGNYRINIDGIVTYQEFPDETMGTYTQLFRNGVIEAVSHFLLRKESDGKAIIRSPHFEKAIMDTCSTLLGFQRASGVEPPITIILTLVAVKGYQMGVSSKALWSMGPRSSVQTIDREVIQSPDVLVENYETVDLPASLKPIFDAVWNAAGWVGSINYDANGEWSDKRQR